MTEEGNCQLPKSVMCLLLCLTLVDEVPHPVAPRLRLYRMPLWSWQQRECRIQQRWEAWKQVHVTFLGFSILICKRELVILVLSRMEP